MMFGSSIVPSTCEWLARICSIRVEPERGRPTMKIGASGRTPAPARGAGEGGGESALAPGAGGGVEEGAGEQRLGLQHRGVGRGRVVGARRPPQGGAGAIVGEG